MFEFDRTCTLYLWLHYGVNSSSRLFGQVSLHYPDLEEAFRLAAAGNSEAFSFLPDWVFPRLNQSANDAFLDRYLDWLTRYKIGVTTTKSPDYPILLHEISDCPPVLFYRGQLDPSPRLPIAVIGSRITSQYGRDIAQKFSYDLVENGCTIISGMAEGIDGYAARGALSNINAPYPTVAVLGSGIDVIYPKSNRDLYYEIMERGAVVTEFLPGTKPLKENFPIRNRIMSGLARGVLVVEAGDRSGTSITAGYALDQGREVFAIPGRLTDQQSIGTNRMIQRGEAKPVFCIEDILQEFDRIDEDAIFMSGPQRVPLSTLSEQERIVCMALLDGTKSFDDLAEGTALPIGELNSLLTAMQFSGIIKPLFGRMFELDTLHTVLVNDLAADTKILED